MEHKVTKSSFDIAQFYDKTKHYRAAVLYYNEVLRQQPNSPEGAIAKQRIAALRSKVGDAAIQSAADIAERQAKGGQIGRAWTGFSRCSCGAGRKSARASGHARKPERHCAAATNGCGFVAASGEHAGGDSTAPADSSPPAEPGASPAATPPQ